MIIRLHLNDKDLASRLAVLGYKTEVKEVASFERGHHSRDEMRTNSFLHVITPDEKRIPAHEFFENLLDSALMDMLIAYNNQQNNLQNESNNR